MRADWEKKPFGAICEHSAFGPRFSGDLYSKNGNVATLRTTDIAEDGRIEYGSMPLASIDLSRFRQHVLQIGDLVITRSGRVGTAAVFRESRLPVLPGAFLIRFRLRREVADPYFYSYYFNSPEGRDLVTSTATGSVQQNLNITSLHRLVIVVPPLETQRAISAFLGALDNKIELNRQLTQTLIGLATDYFDHLYWYSSERGEWSVEPLGKHLDVVRGLSYTGAGLANEGMPMHNLNSIYEGGGYKRTGIKYYRGDYRPRHLVRPGDVVVATVEQGFDELLIAFPALIPTRFGECGLFSQDLFCLRPHLTSPLLPTFTYLSLLRGHLHDEVAGYANGTTINRIPVDALQKPRFAVPPRELVEEIDALVAPLFGRAEVAEDESETLAELRDALLPKLISGELRVRDAEAAVEQAT